MLCSSFLSTFFLQKLHAKPVDHPGGLLKQGNADASHHLASKIVIETIRIS